MKYEIGHEVWQAKFEATTAYIECPDCRGEGRVRVILPDAEHSIECAGCTRGCYPPAGRIQVYDRKPVAVPVTIMGVEIEDSKTEWKTTEGYRVPEENLFDNPADAMARAQEMAAAFDRQERERFYQKEKPTKTWSWHVHYHRRCIRDAKKQIEYHAAKLAVANLKAKDKTEAAA